MPQGKSNKEIIPIIKSDDLFANANDSRFALGVFGPRDVLDYEKNQNSLVKGYLQLRANVYIDQENILDYESKRSDGTELDADDERSVHFVAFERRLGAVAVIASTRLIIKSENDSPLPIETTFKDILPSPIKSGGVEASRFISRHGEDKHQREVKSKIIMAALAYVSTNELGPVFGVIEKRLKRSLELFGVLSEDLAPPILVEEGGVNGENRHTTELMPVRIPTDALRNRFGKEAVEEMTVDVGEFIYWGVNDDKVGL
jgi:N-acyl-L-homoserine lactone synthetase